MDLQAIAALRRFGRHWDALPAMFDRVLPDLQAGRAAQVLLRFLRDEGARPGIVGRGVDGVLLDGLDVLRDVVDWSDGAVVAGQCRTSLASGVEDDLLIEPWPWGWSALQVLLHVVLAAIVPDRAPAVVTTMRNDGSRIVEFVAHYRALGFDRVYIYSNDNADGSDALLDLLAGHDAITFVRNHASGQQSPQRKAYEHSLWKLPELRRHEWVFYADSDELLILPEGFDHDIGRALAPLAARYPERLPSAVCYHWKWVLSGWRFARAGTPLLESFTHARPHGLFKSMVRLADVLTLKKLHFPVCGERAFFVDSRLEPIEVSRTPHQDGMWRHETPCYDGGQLNHYWTRSFEEFAVKQRRGQGTVHADHDYAFARFFENNGAETEANHDPCPPVLLRRVRGEMAALRALPGVAEAERDIAAATPGLLADFGGAAGLRAIYDGLAASMSPAGGMAPQSA